MWARRFLSRVARCSGLVAGAWCLVAGGAAVAAAQQAAAPDVDTLLARVAERIAEYYQRVESVICTEKNTVQPVGHDYAPLGFARVTEYELHVEPDANGDGDNSSDAKVSRRLLRVNGRVPREKDSKDRAGCTDANPLSPEPLAFLLPAHRSEYTFTSGGAGKGKDSHTLIIDFVSGKPEGKGELAEDPRGHPDCFTWSLPVTMKGRVWVDADSYQVVRIEERMATIADINVPVKLQRSHNLSNTVVVERHDTTIRYKAIPFRDPDETMLLPESIEQLIIVRGGLESIRSRQMFSDYRRFLTGARVVK
jgi:hypothetical protein